MKVSSGLCAVIFAAAAWVLPARAATAVDPCRAPDDISVAAPLPKVADALRAGTLNVLAVGSATMFGPEASLAPGTITSLALGTSSTVGGIAPGRKFAGPPSDRAFPLQMANAIRTAIPNIVVKVTVRGGRSLLATDMLSMMRTELAAARYDLVLWQTGTVEAVRNVAPGEFAQTLSEGAEAVDEAGANLILVDPQFSRFLQTNSNLEPYEQGLQQVAAMPGVVLFRRYDLMRVWANDGQIDLERTPRSDRQRTVETLHACLGRHLGRLVIDSAHS